MMLSDRLRELKNSLPSGVNLLAVSKGQPAFLIRSLAEKGQLDFGESRLQEALLKMDELKDIDMLRWHFIGRLQSNKVRSVVRYFEFIHSVDSLSLAERISRISAEEERSPKVLLQVKLREDNNKVGFSSNVLCKEWSTLKQLANLQIVGLMTISPLGISQEDKQALFIDCRDLADELGLKECSMGMSNDWQLALRAGSTWLRLGSALFGPRLDPRQLFDRDITKST